MKWGPTKKGGRKAKTEAVSKRALMKARAELEKSEDIPLRKGEQRRRGREVQEFGSSQEEDISLSGSVPSSDIASSELLRGSCSLPGRE